ncbi:hypothetical protein BSKO_05129 [Bryopsis sp. KO-2023]|nr:hypothetical protein BSKO_05129 [Bryopsis sp. KO-2023]
MVGCAIIVGVGPGLGASLARRFARGGFPVALVARRLEGISPVKESIEAEKGKASCYVADGTDENQVKEAFAKIRAELGEPEVLCYNVGPNVLSQGWPPPTVESITVANFRQGVETGVVGAFLWCKQLLPIVKSAKKGTILFTGATAGLRGAANFSGLSPGKFALRSLSQTLAKELHPCGVHVAHVIVDGIIDTERIRTLMPERPTEEMLDPDAMADEYWKLHTQHPSTWSQEIDLRPFTEKF